MELIKIGKALKTHGYKGHLKIYIDEFYMDDFEEMKAIFINNLPYFILSKDINSDTDAIISLEEINSKEKAQLLTGKEIFAKEEDVEEILEEDPYGDLKGFVLEDKNFGTIGNIEQVIELPHQFLAQVFKNEKEILVPLNEDFIIKIDDKKKIVTVALPEGLLDIYK